MIPTQYNSLPGFRTVYSENDLIRAIAHSEVMVANGQGGGPIEVATSDNQLTQIDSLVNIAELTITGNDDLRTISSVFSRRPIHITSVTTNGLLNTIIVGQSGNIMCLTEISIGRLVSGIATVNIAETGTAPIMSARVDEGRDLIKIYPAGREYLLQVNQGLTLQAATNTTYTIGYFFIPA